MSFQKNKNLFSSEKETVAPFEAEEKTQALRELQLKAKEKGAASAEELANAASEERVLSEGSAAFKKKGVPEEGMHSEGEEAEEEGILEERVRSEEEEPEGEEEEEGGIFPDYIPEEAERKPSFSEKLKSPRFRHGAIASLITVGGIVLLILLNVVVSLLTERFPSLNLDMTDTGKNTLSQTAVDVASSVTEDTRIYILGAEDEVKDDLLYSAYGITYSQVDTLAKKFAELNRNIRMEYVDLDATPGFASKYPDETLRTGSVIVQTPIRYRLLTVDDLFDFDERTYTAYTKVDSALSTAIYQANLKELPLVAIASGHGELLNTASFEQVLTENGFEVTSFSPMTEEVPAGAQILFLPTPTADYTTAEIEKLEAFLKEGADRGILISFYLSQGKLPNLSAFLKDWGIGVTDNVVLESDASHIFYNSATYLLGQLSGEMDLGGRSDYRYLAMPEARQLEKLFSAQADINVYSLISSYETSYAYSLSSLEQPDGNEERAAYPLLILAQKNKATETGNFKSNVVALGSSAMLSGGFVDTTSFGNGQYMIDLFRMMAGAADSASSLEVVSTALNPVDLVFSAEQIKWLGLGVFTVGIPVLVLLIGFIVFFKRRHL